MTISSRASAILASVVLSLAMLAVNLLFEVAGSVPDVDGCGFLSGSLFALSLIYPVIAFAIARRACSIMSTRRRYDAASVLRYGGFIGGLGSAAYMLCGIVGANSAPHAAGLGWEAWGAATGFVLLCYFGGRFGALVAVQSFGRRPLIETGN